LKVLSRSTTKKNDYTEISELISGGPVWRGKDLEAGDVVMKVAQGNAQAVDAVNAFGRLKKLKVQKDRRYV
jgi:hypothetical protein